MELNQLLAAMSEAVTAGEPDDARKLAEQGLAANYDPITLIEAGLRLGMDIVGQCFAEGDMYLPDLVRGGEAMKAAIAVLEPALKASHVQRPVAGKVVIGTVLGDIHEIGKTLVATMLAASGFEVHDLGVNVAPAQFVKAAREMNADLIGLSALLTTTMLNQASVIEALKEAGLRERVKVFIGGAPTGPEWAEKIGADGYAENAVEAARVARSLIEAGRAAGKDHRERAVAEGF